MAGNKRRRTNGGGFRTTEDGSTSVPFPSSSSISTSQPTFLSTFDRESRYPIFRALCAYLSVSQIVSLTRTCKKLSGLYQYLLPIQWDVDKALLRWVDDPLGFRSQMARCDALIDGDFSFHYFERIQMERGPLDVSIQQGFRVELFSKYLLDIAGYLEVKRKKHGRNVEDRTFKSMANHKVVIHLSVTRLTPVQSILSDNVTTMEVNFLSWNKAYSLFPLPTFIQYKSYLLRQWDDVTRLAAQSDSRNGWKVQGVLWPEEKHRNQPIRERRRVGDHYAWIIPFDTRKVEWSKTPDYVLEHACFTMDQISDDDNNDDDDDYTDPKDVRSYTIKATKLESAVLRYTYLCGDNRMRDFILRRFRSFTILELRMLDPAQRPANYDQILTRPWDIDGALDGFEPPASWRYRDDELPKLYEAFEKRKSE